MRTRLGVIAAIVAALAVVAVACGDDDGSNVRTVDEGSGTGSGATGSGSGAVSGSGGDQAVECVPVGDLSSADTRVNVTLSEYAIEVDPTEASTGNIGFVTVNDGAEPHELVIIKGVAPDDLPTDDRGALDESALPEGALIGKVEPFPAGETCNGTFELAAGDYTLVCNIVEEDEHGHAHLEEGMVTTFTVT
jgi:hypothetical protein